MKELTNLMQAQFDKMCATGKLFRSEVTGQKVWDVYLQAFNPEDNPIFRDPNSTVHNCNFCKNFVRRYGNIVAIGDDNEIMSIWGVDAPEEYKNSANTLNNLIANSKIVEVFFETYNELNSLPYEKNCTKTQATFKLGVEKNTKRYTKEEAEMFGVVKPNEEITFDHFNLSISKQFVDQTGSSVESIIGNYRDSKNVFQRGMEEISLDTLILVKDLINQESLLDGKTHLFKVEKMITFKTEYESKSQKEKDNYCWVASYNNQLAKFRNELIGVLCSELSEGKELNEACKSWNKRVDPINYMKTTTPITKKQIEEAKLFVEENGFVESFDRRFATIDDIKASEILHVNMGDGSIKNVSIFDNVKSTSTRHKRSEFDGIDEVTIDKFMSDILPNCTSVEAFLLSKHEGNLVSLTTSNKSESKPIFKWNNNYSWTFNGNLAGKSQIKEAVKGRGGNVIGDVRISLAFPLTTDDYDLHVQDTDGNHIYYSNVRQKHNSSGMLDLDAQGVDGAQTPEKRVENIIFTDKSKIKNGNIKIWVENYSQRGLRVPFDIEIEIEGDITTLTYDRNHSGNKAEVGNIVVKNGMFELHPDAYMTLKESTNLSKEVYGLETNNFHKVNLVCLSPNHWGDNNVGNKHYLFMLDGCKCPTDIRSFHNENLLPELAEHRKVLEVLGATNMIKPTDKQLSGLGFNATVRDEIVVRLQGSFKRVIKIKF